MSQALAVQRRKPRALECAFLKLECEFVVFIKIGVGAYAVIGVVVDKVGNCYITRLCRYRNRC